MSLTPAEILAALEATVRRVVREELARAAERRCGFCGLALADVRRLVGGGDGHPFICDECVMSLVRLLVVSKPVAAIGPPPPIPKELADQSFVRSRDVDRHGGLVYAVATVPDLDVRRIKVGFTSRPIENRLEAFRTANPTAALLGLWPAPSDAEDVAHRLIEGRVGNTEVFHVPDVVVALTSIDEEFRRRWP